jgi:SAM-dependent methyltransferase
MSSGPAANSIVAEFLEVSDSDIAANRDEFAAILKLIRRYRAVDTTTRLLEIGTGTGWFQILCREEGIPSCGLEIDEQLVAYARQLGASHGVQLDLRAGNLDEVDLGQACYDVIVATSTFEHVRDWRGGLAKVYRALKPGGAFYFGSTNKFSFTSGEYSFPFYGWYPDAVRYRLRQYFQGPQIMQWGIDFNQFTHPQLRRTFKRLGFRGIYDRIDALDPDNLAHPTWKKRLLLKTLKTVPGAHGLATTFAPTTLFVCVK